MRNSIAPSVVLTVAVPGIVKQQEKTTERYEIFE